MVSSTQCLARRRSYFIHSFNLFLLFFILLVGQKEEGKTERSSVSTLNVVNTGWMEQCGMSERDYMCVAGNDCGSVLGYPGV